MTTETVLKLDSIKSADDLTWRKESYDAGHPECLCSACGQPVRDSMDFAEETDYIDSAGNSLEEQARDNFPIRCWSGEGENMIEAVLHTSCFMFLHAKGILHE